MKTISMLEFRKKAESFLKQVSKGQAFVLTYRGKPVARLEPIKPKSIAADDPIFTLREIASPTAKPLTNDEIDRAVYGA